MRDFTKKYFHLNSPAVYNSSAKNGYETAWNILITVDLYRVKTKWKLLFVIFYFNENLLM